MTEGLFLITTLFVAYVIYVIVNEKKTSAPEIKPVETSTPPEANSPPPAEEKPKAAEPEIKSTATVATKPATASKPATAKKTSSATAKSEPQTMKGSGLKDPKTGEVATTYTNYRFTKRWIKEALVEEKLVDKIYKNDELTADIEAKIKTGIAKLEGMKKYKP